MDLGRVVRWGGAALLSSCLYVADASGQASGLERVQEGDSVRLHFDGALPIDAAFQQWQSEQMLLRVEGLDEVWPVSVEDLSSLQVYALRTPRESFRHGAVLGAVSGIFVGAAVGLLLHTSGVIDDPDAPPAQLMTNTLTGAGVGAATGLLAGGLYYGRHPGYGWISITLPTY